LPLPETPNNATKRLSPQVDTNWPTTFRRPKKREEFSTPYAASPWYGGFSLDRPWSEVTPSCERAASVAACRQRRSHSAVSPSQARTKANVTARLGNCRPPAAFANEAAE
jgi:hypothetical protein